MSKVMIVEDDDSLREIYGIRLTAEGYAVVSAHDGEEALAVAVRERPDLVISDVMMPKISGFDMLDILRSTPETQNIKVIMMTALSSDDQRERGENLGADRYLVKSQVGIEDVINVVHEVLGDRNENGTINTMVEPVTSSVPTNEPTPAMTQPVVASSQPQDMSTAQSQSMPTMDVAAQTVTMPQPGVFAQPTTNIISEQPSIAPQQISDPVLNNISQDQPPMTPPVAL